MRMFHDTNVNFMGFRKNTYVVSIILAIASIISMIVFGLTYSIDFTGGLALELDLTPPANSQLPALTVHQIRLSLQNNGIEESEIQEITAPGDLGRKYFLIHTKGEGLTVTNKVNTEKATPVATPAAVVADTMKAVAAGESTAVKDTLQKEVVKPVVSKSRMGDRIIEIVKKDYPQYYNEQTSIRSQEEVGPKAGDDLRTNALWAILISLAGIGIYIWARFRFTWGIAAAFALAHDLFITVGILSIAHVQIGMTVLAALLTIAGYSINDTIVVFDRIRENLKIYRKEGDTVIFNKSINETLSRTVITVLTVFLTDMALLLFGGSVIRDFALTFMIGIVLGTFSSIFVASALVLDARVYMARKKKENIKKK